MKSLIVSVEINGKFSRAGKIEGNSSEDARFSYDEEYMCIPGIKPISISLPFRHEAFSARKTRCFFEGLLPEGFSRRAVAGWAKADHEDYLAILAKLGQECLGALKVEAEDNISCEYAYELLEDEQVKALASEGATKSTEILMETHLSLTGASGKAGLYYDRPNNRWYLPRGCASSTHIVKQSHVRYNQIVLNEQLCIRTARRLGIEVPDSFVVNMGRGNDEDVLFATERFDRKLNYDHIVDNLPCPFRQHQEDFCQALGIPAADKYENYPRQHLKKMFRIIRDYSSDPLTDQMKLWDIIVFNYMVGNTDCHLKNYSFLYDEDFKGIRLAPAYDIVRTRAYGTTREMSYYIGGELDIDKIKRENFRLAAKEAGIGVKLAMKHFDRLAEGLAEAAGGAMEEMSENGFDMPLFWRDFMDSLKDKRL